MVDVYFSGYPRAIRDSAGKAPRRPVVRMWPESRGAPWGVLKAGRSGGPAGTISG